MFDEDNYLCEIEDLKAEIDSLNSQIYDLVEENRFLRQQLEERDDTISSLRDTIWEINHGMMFCDI